MINKNKLDVFLCNLIEIKKNGHLQAELKAYTRSYPQNDGISPRMEYLTGANF